MFQGTIDYSLEVSRGVITGENTINKFGRSTNVDSGTITDLWDKTDQAIWLAPTAARIHTIASTDGDDDTGGAGANSVTVSYLPDWDTEETTETVTGDLSSGIAMTNAAVMINRMAVNPQATSTTPNAGTITATAASDSTVTSQITIGKGQTQQAIYGIPSVCNAYMKSYYASLLRANLSTNERHADINILYNPNPDVQTVTFLTKHTSMCGTRASDPFQHKFDPYKKFAGPGIIKVQAIGSADNLDVSGGFDMILRRES